jgi:hypothetical protein
MKFEVKFNESNTVLAAEFSHYIEGPGGGGTVEDLDAVLDVQEGLIDELKGILATKASGGKAAVIEPLEVTANGEYAAPDGVDGYSPVVVSVPIPDGYIQPEGALEVTENGAHDVMEYASVNVNVPVPDGYIMPSGSLEITENGTHDVTAYASVAVNVPTGGGADENVLTALIDRTVTEIEVPSGTKTIGANTFMNCTKLVNISLPNGLTSIGSSAFQACTSLGAISLPDSVTSIGGNAFMGCSKLTLPHLPSDLTSVGTTAFRTCTALESITFHSTPTVGANAFFGCSKLKNIYVPWAEGEVANAPWGATNATIHYNSEV